MTNDRLILLGFMLSNASAFIYEVVWARELSYVFGTSVYAISTVLATFMLGLALGSFFFGKYVDGSRNPLRVFAGLEIGIGIYGIFTIFLFDYLPAPYLFLRGLLDVSSLFPYALFFLSLTVLLVPTVLIGATFPVVSKIYARNFGELGKRVGVAYSLDTLGAAVGAFASGFVLLPALGLSRTILLAAFLNLVVGFVVLFFSEAKEMRPIGKKRRSKGGSLDRVLIFAFFLSGFAALVYEVTWTRLLSWIFGSSVYAFAMMLTAFMLGLAIGSYLVGRLVDKWDDLISAFALIELSIGFYALTLLLIFFRLDELYLKIFFMEGSLEGMFFLFFLIIFALFLIPTTLMGATMPLMIKLYSRDPRRIGGDIGAMFSSNTLGGMLGAFIAGFVLVPSGVESISLFAAGVNMFVAFLMWGYIPFPVKKKLMLGATTSLILAGFLGTAYTVAYDVDIRWVGAYYNPKRFSEISEYRQYKAETEVIFKMDDPHGLVTVTRDESSTALQINGKIDASNTGDIPTQYMLAYAPLFTHDDPKKILNIGLGGGFTLSAIEDLPVETIDVVEINPAVVEATRMVFSEFNDKALDDSRVNLIIDDARNYLLSSNKKYDVIISEPSNPWLAGESGLFTREFYDLVRAHLYDGGVFAQWVPLYDHRADDFRIFLGTFQSVFPHVQVYSTKLGDAILVGSMERRGFDYSRFKETLNEDRFKGHLASMKNVIGNPWFPDVDYYLSFNFMNDEEVLDYVAGIGEFNTDDKPILEFRTAKVHLDRKDIHSKYPFNDVLNFKLRREGMILVVPNIVNAVSINGSNHFFDLLGVGFVDIDWDLLDFGYLHSLSLTSPLDFIILRSVVYNTGLGELAWIRLDAVPVEVDVDVVKFYLADSQNILPPHLREVGEMDIDSRRSYLFTDSVKLYAAWQCLENEAIYVLMLPYTEDLEGAKELFGHARCLY